MTGVVKFFDAKKGYGFIKRDDQGADVFVHYREIQGTGYKQLAEGDRVEFDLRDSDRGPRAVDVVKK